MSSILIDYLKHLKSTSQDIKHISGISQAKLKQAYLRLSSWMSHGLLYCCDTSLTHFGHFLNALLTLPCHFPANHWHFLDTLLTLSQHFLNISSTLPQHFLNTSLTILQQFFDNFMTIPLHFLNTFSTPQHFLGNSSTLPWHFHDTYLSLP